MHSISSASSASASAARAASSARARAPRPALGIPRHGLRRERTDGKITRAVLELAKGIGAVSIEAVAKRSGVAKTTIYRRYANTDDLLRHLSVAVGEPLDFSGFDTTFDGLRGVLKCIVDCFDEELGLKAIGVVLSSSNDYLANLAERVVTPAQQRFADFIGRGVSSGAFRGDVSVPFLFQTVIGSMMAAKALSDSSHDTWAHDMASLLWPTLAAR